MEARSGEIRQRSASVNFIISNKKIRGAAGTDHFILFTSACPPVSAFSAEESSYSQLSLLTIKDHPLPARDFLEERNREIRQRSASVNFIISNKKIRGAAGTHYFILITSACPQIGAFSAEESSYSQLSLLTIEDHPLPARGF